MRKKQIGRYEKNDFAGRLIRGVMALLICMIAFGTIKAGAQEAATSPEPRTVAYLALSNKIIGAENTALYVLKAEKGNKIKAKTTPYVIDNSGEIALTDMGVKSTNKDVYIFACDKAFEEDATNVSANFVIKAQAAKKIVAKIDYTQADIPDSDTVLSITAVGTDGKEIIDPSCVWSDTIDGEYKTSSLFTEAKLNKMLSDGGGTIFVKMRGRDIPATFSSKAIKVKIAKPAKAPKVKVDPAKDGITLKNGYDFAYAYKDEQGNWFVEQWLTILPYLKTAKIKTKAESIVETTRYNPLDKKDSNARDDGEKVAFSACKINIVSFKDIFRKLGPRTGENPAIAVRKSTTLNKPASEVQYIEIENQTDHPIVFTEANVLGQYKVASTKDFNKKGFIIDNVENYNATNGYAETFKVATPEANWADKNPAVYEYCVVNIDDINKIDWSSFAWKKFSPGKTKVTGKLKTKYDTSEKKAVTAVLNAGNPPQEFVDNDYRMEIPSTVSTLLLIRRKGIKSGAPVRPSDYISLFVIKDGSEYVLYSTVANGEHARLYTVDFYSFKENADGSSGEFAKDGSMESFSVWVASSQEKKVKLPDVTDGELWLAGMSNGKLVPTQKIVLDEKGEYPLSGNELETSVKVIVRKYAKNITVKAVYGTKTDGRFTRLDLDPQILGFVKNGVPSNLAGETPVDGGGNPEVYIGSPYNRGGGEIGQLIIPEGYKLASDATELAAKGKGYCEASYNSPQVTYTPLEADSAELVIYVTVEEKTE